MVSGRQSLVGCLIRRFAMTQILTLIIIKLFTWIWLSESVFDSGNDYGMKMRILDHVFDNMVVDDFTVRIILPERSELVLNLRFIYSIHMPHKFAGNLNWPHRSKFADRRMSATTRSWTTADDLWSSHTSHCSLRNTSNSLRWAHVTTCNEMVSRCTHMSFSF